MPWYLIWAQSNGDGARQETYRFYDEEPSEGVLKDDSETFGDGYYGHGERGFRHGFRKINCPPLDWLQKKMQNSQHLRDRLLVDISFYEAEIARVERAAQAQTAQLSAQERPIERSDVEGQP